MSLSQIRNAENVKPVEVEKCRVHGVMAGKGKCSGCLLSKLERERREAAIMRERVKSSWLDLDV